MIPATAIFQINSVMSFCLSSFVVNTSSIFDNAIQMIDIFVLLCVRNRYNLWDNALFISKNVNQLTIVCQFRRNSIDYDQQIVGSSLDDFQFKRTTTLVKVTSGSFGLEFWTSKVVLNEGPHFIRRYLTEEQIWRNWYRHVHFWYSAFFSRNGTIFWCTFANNSGMVFKYVCNVFPFACIRVFIHGVDCIKTFKDVLLTRC